MFVKHIIKISTNGIWPEHSKQGNNNNDMQLRKHRTWVRLDPDGVLFQEETRKKMLVNKNEFNKQMHKKITQNSRLCTEREKVARLLKWLTMKP